MIYLVYTMPYIQHKKHKQQKKKKLDTINNKNFFASQDTIKKVQRQPTEWVKSLSDQDNVSRIT